MKSHRFQYLLIGFTVQTFLALIWTASITSSGSFLLGFSKARLAIMALLLVLGITTLVLAVHFRRKPQLNQTVDQFSNEKLVGHHVLSLVFFGLILITVCSLLPLIFLLPGVGKVLALNLWGSDQTTRIIAIITRIDPFLLVVALSFLETGIYLSINHGSDLISDWKELRSHFAHYR
ncbi:MAG TPA: hypothetical protein VMC62_06510, partial [Longilinea sp.]|nr:hypothetical protein [Longilinea sp.]